MRWIVSRGSRRSIGIRPIRDKGRKGRRRDSGYKHVHEHQFNSSSAILCSARYPITHKALITQLISIYLITPSLPGTISTGSGRESLPPLPSPPASLSPSPISLAPRDHSTVSFSRCSFDPSRKSSTRPCYSHSCRMRIARAASTPRITRLELIETTKETIDRINREFEYLYTTFFIYIKEACSQHDRDCSEKV